MTLAVWVLAFLRFALGTLTNVIRVLLIVHDFLALLKLAFELKLVHSVHNEPVDFGVLASPASFRTGHVLRFEATLAIQALAFFAFSRVQDYSTTYSTNEMIVKFLTC
jgi:hypothetical protein